MIWLLLGPKRFFWHTLIIGHAKKIAVRSGLTLLCRFFCSYLMSKADEDSLSLHPISNNLSYVTAAFIFILSNIQYYLSLEPIGAYWTDLERHVVGLCNPYIHRFAYNKRKTQFLFLFSAIRWISILCISQLFYFYEVFWVLPVTLFQIWLRYIWFTIIIRLHLHV